MGEEKTRVIRIYEGEGFVAICLLSYTESLNQSTHLMHFPSPSKPLNSYSYLFL